MIRGRDQIEEQFDLSYDFEERYRGMSYSEGVRAALDWVTGMVEDPPFDPNDLEE